MTDSSPNGGPSANQLNLPLQPQGSQTSPIRQNSLFNSTQFSAITHLLAEDRQEGQRLSMDGKISIIDYDDWLQRYVPVSDDYREPTVRKLASNFKSEGVVRPESDSYGDMVSTSRLAFMVIS